MCEFYNQTLSNFVILDISVAVCTPENTSEKNRIIFFKKSSRNLPNDAPIFQIMTWNSIEKLEWSVTIKK